MNDTSTPQPKPKKISPKKLVVWLILLLIIGGGAFWSYTVLVPIINKPAGIQLTVDQLKNTIDQQQAALKKMQNKKHQVFLLRHIHRCQIQKHLHQ